MTKIAICSVVLVACSGTARFGDGDASSELDACGECTDVYVGDASTSDVAIGDASPAPFGKAWAFGDSNTRLYFDGTSWSVDTQSQDAGAASLKNAWVGPESLWVVGSQWTVDRFAHGAWTSLPSTKSLDLPDGGSVGSDTGVLGSVWGAAEDDVWVVEDNLALNNRPFLHWDGSQWTRSLDTVSGGGAFVSIFGVASNDIWAIGNKGLAVSLVAYHYDGSHWTAQTGPTDIVIGPVGLWGSANDIWLGAAKNIWHCNGATWSTSFTSTGEAVFESFFGTAEDLWVASASTNTLHYDGSQWTPAPTKVSASTTAVGGTSTHDMWAVGLAGVAAHFDGASWTLASTGTQVNLQTVLGVTAALGK